MAQRLLKAYDEVPNGTQCHCKAYITTALGDLIVLNPADSHLEAMARAGQYMFGLATCVSAQVREKPDDPLLNYFIRGCAAGLILGAHTHNYGTTAVSCVYTGTTATLFKIGKLEGWDLLATPKV